MNYMRGLRVFISDIRNCKTREEEEQRINKEMHHIRQKFRSETLSSYNKKKYIAKLMYMYLVGYEIDFGIVEATALLNSSKLSEKVIGYLACGMLINENSQFTTMIVNSIRNDLIGKNEVAQCLALSAVADIGGEEMAEALLPNVQALLLANPQTTKSAVRKKAALCYVRLFRKAPSIVEPFSIADQLVPLLNDRNVGFLTSLMSLLLSAASRDSAPFVECLPRVIYLLHKIGVRQEVMNDYFYYHVPCPWLQVKLLRFLQYFETPSDPTIRRELSEALSKIISGTEVGRGVNRNNITFAIFFEAVQVAIHFDLDESMMNDAATLLWRHLGSRDSNIRYLALETMTSLARHTGLDEQVRKYHGTIVSSLDDDDTSIQRRALDLLFELCNESNSELIVNQLLDHLEKADFEIREELVLKIAVLAEKFAKSFKWFVDVSLKLITTAPDAISDDVWHRSVHIITRNNGIQQYATAKVFKILHDGATDEPVVRVSAYILGEFGNLIADDEKADPHAQFKLLKARYGTSNAQTKAIILSAYGKMVSWAPEELRDLVQAEMKSQEFDINLEIQQRAAEYRKLTDQTAETLANSVLEMIPPFPERESILERQLHHKEHDLADKRATDSSKPTRERQTAKTMNRAMSSEDLHNPGDSKKSAGSEAAMPEHPLRQGSDLIEVEEPAAEKKEAAPEVGVSKAVADDLADLGLGDSPAIDNAPAYAASEALSPEYHEASPKQIQAWLTALTTKESGVLYEDTKVQIGVKIQVRAPVVRFGFFVGNKSQHDLTSVLASVVPGLAFDCQVEDPPSFIAAKTQAQFFVSLRVRRPLSELPVLRFSFATGETSAALALGLPLYSSKLVVPVQGMDSPRFMGEWGAINGTPMECKQIFSSVYKPINLNAAYVLLQKGLNLSVLAGLDPNPDNIVAVGSMKVAEGGAAGILVMVRLEAKKDASMFRATVKARDAVLSKQILDTITRELGEAPK